MGMILLLVQLVASGRLMQGLKNFTARTELLFLCAPLVMVVASGLWSEDKTEWLNWVRIKLPLLALPLAFAAIQTFSPKQFVAILYVFISAMVVSTLIVFINYAMHYDEINQNFLRGGGIPVPFSHIRHTLMMSFAFFAGIRLMEDEVVLKSQKEKILLFTACVFLFAGLHVLTVRSGLLALYIAAAYYIFQKVLITKKNWIGIVMLCVMLASPFVAYKTVPSIQNKVKYMLYDLELYRSGDFLNTNDGVRITSMKVGLEVWKKNMLVGAGAGDLKAACQKVFDTRFPHLNEYSRKLPHNQFIWTLASLGIVGLLVLMVSFFMPLFSAKIYNDWLFVVFHLIIFCSLFFEHTFEEQIGTGFYSLMLLILMNRFKK